MAERLEYLLIGAMRRSHGVHGAVKVESYSGETEHFTVLRDVEAVSGSRTRKLQVESVAVHNGVPVLTFVGITTPEEARLLHGWELRVPAAAGAQLNEGEYYVAELVGMTVISGGERVGPVVAVVEGGQAPLLEVEHVCAMHGLRRSLIPFMDPFIGSVDRERNEIDLVERWILDSE